MALTTEKVDLVRKKAQYYLPAVVLRTDIIVIMNIAWDQLFAIADCGWNPLNCNILCLTEAIATMIEEDKEK